MLDKLYHCHVMIVDIQTTRVKNAIHYIESNLKHPLSLEKVASYVCLSKYHFSREFKSATGDKIGDYIRRRRITQSANELITTSKSIIEIAETYQFDSQEAYTRSFKSVYQITPNTYRKNNIDQIAFKRNGLSSERVNHLQNNISLSPDIINTNAKKLIGLHCKTSLVQNNIPTLWKIFTRRKFEISQDIGNGLFGISGYRSEHGFDPKQFSVSSMLEKWATVEAVSYTHLTLPTICSV